MAAGNPSSKIAAARNSAPAGRGRNNDDVEAAFTARRAKVQGHE
jgi:hypothetical protein